MNQLPGLLLSLDDRHHRHRRGANTAAGTNNPPTRQALDFLLRYSRSLHGAGGTEKTRVWPPNPLPYTVHGDDMDLAHLPDWAFLRGTYTSLVAFVAHLSSSCARPKEKQKKKRDKRTLVFSSSFPAPPSPHFFFPSSNKFKQKQPAPTPEILDSLPSRDASPANSFESCRPSTASTTNQPASQPAKKPRPRRADWPTALQPPR
ncbi:hypothetical protein QBC39DRAFT_108214 [Podospora conica]|nr:hypothetical protein QBC39DRAFT_108214 [Schizothecium conicum]